MVAPLTSLIRPSRGPVLPAFERLAPPPAEDLVAAEIEARTAAGDVVIELHGRGGWVARSGLNRLRRVFDIEATALTRLQAELVLRPPDLRHLDAAINALAVQPRGDVGLRQALLELFTSRCATCGRAVVVEEFHWEGDSRVPARKSYRCEGCRGRNRTADPRPVPVDEEDIRRAREMWRSPSLARESLRSRFPVPESGHALPGQLLDLYTPRTLEAIAALTERLDADLRAAPIQAALRLALAHVVLPASRLNRHPGRPATLRVTRGRLRVPAERGWRERNPWLLFEEGVRHVRAFVQRLEGAPAGAIQARLGTDLTALVDGSSNVVLRQGSAATPGVGPSLPADRPVRPGRLDPRSRIRLVLSQPPIHWSPENLAFGYLATSIVLGREASETLPLEAIFGGPAGSEWSWEVAALRRSLSAVHPVLAADGKIVLLLDPTGPAGLAAAALGGVGAGLRLSGALLTENGDAIGGTLEFTPPDRAGEEERPALPGEAARDTASDRIRDVPFHLAAVERSVSDVAVAVLQARGEPARFERLLGEVLIGLDGLGHLRRLVGTRTFTETEERAERAAEAMGLFGEVAAPVSDDAGNGANPSEARSWRDPALPVRRPLPEVATTENAAETPREVASTVVATDDTATASQPDVERPPDEHVGELDDRERTGSGSDPVRLLLEIVIGELRRPDHPRLIELEPGRWWLRDPADLAEARLPLSDRLEWSVFSLLTTSGGLPETAFFDRVAGMFRGHDMPDEELVRACLESYRGDDGADGLIRTPDSLRDRYDEHGALVGMLAEYGHRLGLRCWISRREQRRTFKGAPLGDLLSDAEQRAYLPLVSPGEAEALEAVDCIWYVRGKASFLFEVEWTAMLADPILRRGSRIQSSESVVRFLVIPPERTELVRLKLSRSPVLRQAMEAGNWHILKSDHLRRLYARETADLDDLAPLLGLDPEIEQQGEQLPLFA